jgi:hypothetical protein
VSPTAARYSAGQQVLLKSGQTATIVGIDSVDKSYKVMGADNQYRSVKPDEIEKPVAPKYSNYQQSGPNPENPEELSINQQDVNVDQAQ